MPRVPFDPATDYYQLLGVEPAAPPEAIQAAYRRLAKAFHPDLNAGSKAAADRMARLNVAKSVLLDRQTRAAYDQMRAPRRAAAAAVAQVAQAQAAPAHTVDGFTVRYAPYEATARARYRVVSNAATRQARRSTVDRGTGILLLVALPLIAALCLYLFQAFQLSVEPLKAVSSDAFLVPGQTNRPTSRGAADAVFTMVHAQPVNRELALRANRFILARSDSTPESEELQADGRRLMASAQRDDAAGWDATVNHICQLAGRC